MSGGTTTRTPGASRRPDGGIDPLREKGGDSDWYGYCVDDPVNRVDVRGLAWSLFGGGGESAAADGGEEKAQPRTGQDDNPYCKDHPCDDNGTMQGDYKPIETREGGQSFVLDFFDPIVTPFMWYYDYKNRKD
ncbi:MAG: hypothetical protein RDU24_12425 [Humidesulfovibrio sp.]|uniref:hypothetical protein n=1 Tax=Humidesulfovibrio sp. TaxID=2910988 RepID=UPI0027F0C3D9|nr:hypothetical protein [Humidesulfovibrio sp.]MDQ7836180.1 hypothetical protein [Humidesulfovibrio sp.]